MKYHLPKKREICATGHWSQGWKSYDPILGRLVFLKEFKRENWNHYWKYIKDSNVEYQKMKLLKDSPYYPRLYGYAVNKGKAYIAMEYVPGFCLAEIYSNHKCGRKKAVRITIKILQGIKDMHKSGLYHGDLQMRNVIINNKNENTVKIIDFGQSMYRNKKGVVSGKINTAFWGYTPPEQDRNMYFDNSDYYGAICICVRLITGQDPFLSIQSKNEVQLVQSKIPYWNVGDKNLQNILRKSLSFYPFQRFKTADDLIKVLLPFC